MEISSNYNVRMEGNSNENTTTTDSLNKKTNNIALKVLAGVTAGAAVLCAVGAITTGLVVPLSIGAGVCGLVSLTSLISLYILHKKNSNTNLSSESQNNLEDSSTLKNKLIQEVEKTSSFSIEKPIPQEVRWDKFLNWTFNVLGTNCTHNEDGLKELNKNLEKWAENSYNKEAVLNFVKNGLLEHNFTDAYFTNSEQNLNKEWLSAAMKETKYMVMPEQPFQRKDDIKFLKGQKFQVSFEYKTQDFSTKNLTHTFSIQEIDTEKNSVQLKVERTCI